MDELKKGMEDKLTNADGVDAMERERIRQEVEEQQGAARAAIERFRKRRGRACARRLSSGRAAVRRRCSPAGPGDHGLAAGVIRRKHADERGPVGRAAAVPERAVCGTEWKVRGAGG